jgi:peptidoglycan/LPS O-acetylase OafA/YrhL
MHGGATGKDCAMQTDERLHALDAVRGTALLLGLVLHASMSFFLPVPVFDSQQSTTLAVAFFVIHIFRMAAFYFIAGFFARLVVERKGVNAFVRDRARRIGIPLLVGWAILAPMTIGIIIWAAISTYGVEAVRAQSHGFQGVPLVHVWFLYYLCIFYILALALRSLFNRVVDRSGVLRHGVDGVMGFIMRSGVAPVVLAVPACLWLYYDETWSLWGGIATPDTGLTPQLTAMIAFGVAFGFGWLLQRRMELLLYCEKYWLAYLAFAVALTVYCLSLVPLKPSFVPEAGAAANMGPGWDRFSYAAAYTMAIWGWTFALVGVAMRYCSGFSAWRRYLADASYWLYLVHIPIIFLMQFLIECWSIHWAIKFTLILAVTMGLGLLTYHYLVRFSVIGAVLNGRRRRKSPVGLSVSAAE